MLWTFTHLHSSTGWSLKHEMGLWESHYSHESVPTGMKPIMTLKYDSTYSTCLPTFPPIHTSLIFSMHYAICTGVLQTSIKDTWKSKNVLWLWNFQAVEELLTLMRLFAGIASSDASREKTKEEEAFEAAFRRDTIMLYQNCLDGGASWTTLIRYRPRMHRYFMLMIVIVLKGQSLLYRGNVFLWWCYRFSFGLGLFEGFLFIVYQLTQSYFCLFFFT